jgi:hypothetical protein
VLDREYFDTHRIEWEALAAKYLQSRKPDDLAPVKHGKVGDRYTGLTVYGDCLLFEMSSDSLSARRAVVYKFDEGQIDRNSDQIFFSRSDIHRVVGWDGPWACVAFE